MVDEQEIKKWFATEVKERMEDEHLRPYHMAYLCHMKLDRIYPYLNGTRLPDPWCLILMADCFDCSVNDLLGYEEIDNIKVFETYRAVDMFADEKQYAACFADRFVQYMYDCGLSIETVSERSGISLATVKHWVGKRPSLPRTQHLLQICDALNCTPSELLGY